MNRTTDTYREIDKFGSGKDGHTEGEPGVTAPTNIRADELDAFQEEICGAIEDAGVALDSADLGQLAGVAVNLAATYDVTGTAVASGSVLTLAANNGDTSRYTLASNTILPPSKGLYLIVFNLYVAVSPTANPQTITVNLVLGAGVISIRGTRFSATAADSIHLSASVIYPMDPSLGSPNGVISLKSGTSNLSISGAGNNHLSIMRVHGTD